MWCWLTHAAKAVNISLTLRNWFIGQHIAVFELQGADRARYGDKLLSELTQALRDQAVSDVGKRQLYGYLAFYRAYPQIVRTASAQSAQTLLPNATVNKVRTASAGHGLRVQPRLCGAGGIASGCHRDAQLCQDGRSQRTAGGFDQERCPHSGGRCTEVHSGLCFFCPFRSVRHRARRLHQRAAELEGCQRAHAERDSAGRRGSVAEH